MSPPRGPRFQVACEACHLAVGPSSREPRCPACGAKLTFSYEEDGTPWPGCPTAAGMWAYAPWLPLADPTLAVTLGEGATPLLAARGRWGCRVFWKQEGLNPTGSQKDRALALAVSRAREIKAPRVVLASTGSAGLAAAAYCARAALPCLVLVPQGTPAERVGPMAALGAHLVELEGTFVQIERLLGRLEGDPGWYEATTKRAANPYQAEAPKTIAYEVAAQLGDAPDWLVVPVGGGATLHGIWRGFRDLARAGRITRLPRVAAVQPARFNTLEVALARGLHTEAELLAIAMDEGVETVARNLKHGVPPDGLDALRAVRESGGTATSVSDGAALAAQGRLGREEGLFCEPSSAVVAAALEGLVRTGTLRRDETVVCVLTGSGLREAGVLPEIRPVRLPADAGPGALDRLCPV